MALIREAVEACAPPGSVPPRVQGIHGRSTGAGSRQLCYRRTISPLNHYRRRMRGGGSLDLPLECNWLRAMVPVHPGLDSRGKK
jgi:hypothetical protein